MFYAFLQTAKNQVSQRNTREYCLFLINPVKSEGISNYQNFSVFSAQRLIQVFRQEATPYVKSLSLTMHPELHTFMFSQMQNRNPQISPSVKCFSEQLSQMSALGTKSLT